MARVLITGASGFTGKHLRAHLQRLNYEVVGLGPAGMDDVQCDIEDMDELQVLVGEIAPDFVVHLAAISSPAYPDSKQLYGVNVIGTENLLRALAARDTPPTKVLLASSANVYGSNGDSTIDEGICPKPLNHYGCSKLAMEQIAATWFERMPILIVRPFNYTGVGQDQRFLVPKIVRYYAERRASIPLGNVDVRRDFSDVRDVVEMYEMLLKASGIGETVNICSGRSTSIRELLRSMEGIAGTRLEVEQDPSLLRRTEIPELKGSTSKLDGMVGQIPRRDILDTLEWMYQSEVHV